jgi:hypothetical protein
MDDKSWRQSVRESLQDFLVQYPLYRLVDWITDNPRSALFVVITAVGWLINEVTHLNPMFQPYLTGAVASSVLFLVGNVVFYGLRRKTVKFLTLKDLFETDWPDLIGYYSVSTLAITSDRQTNPDISLAWRVNGDFRARSKFLAFFLDPIVSSSLAFQVCLYIADNYQEFIDTTNSEVDISGQLPSDTAVTHLRDMPFSGRIFFYYENLDFSMEQKGWLEVQYRKKDLAIQFHGIEHQWLHRGETKRLRKTPLVAHNVLLPKTTGSGLRIEVRKLSP